VLGRPLRLLPSPSQKREIGFPHPLRPSSMTLKKEERKKKGKKRKARYFQLNGLHIAANVNSSIHIQKKKKGKKKEKGKRGLALTARHHEASLTRSLPPNNKKKKKEKKKREGEGERE